MDILHAEYDKNMVEEQKLEIHEILGVINPGTYVVSQCTDRPPPQTQQNGVEIPR